MKRKKKFELVITTEILNSKSYLSFVIMCLSYVVFWEMLSWYFWLFKAGKVAAAMSAGDRLVIVDIYVWEKGRGKKNW